VTYTLFFLMTTKYNHFSTLIYRACPYPIDQIFLMSYRFIFITLRMVDSMLKALRSRGGGLIKSTLRQGRMFAEVFALTLIRSYDKADRISKAMEARGFSGRYMAATRLPPVRPAEYVLMLASAALAAYLMLYFR
jgi:cobalt/nickel transport system permease protein